MNLEILKIEKEILRQREKFYLVTFKISSPALVAFEVSVWVDSKTKFIDVVPKAKSILEVEMEKLLPIVSLGSLIEKD